MGNFLHFRLTEEPGETPITSWPAEEAGPVNTHEGPAAAAAAGTPAPAPPATATAHVPKATHEATSTRSAIRRRLRTGVVVPREVRGPVALVPGASMVCSFRAALAVSLTAGA